MVTLRYTGEEPASMPALGLDWGPGQDRDLSEAVAARVRRDDGDPFVVVGATAEAGQPPEPEPAPVAPEPEPTPEAAPVDSAPDAVVEPVPAPEVTEETAAPQEPAPPA